MPEGHHGGDVLGGDGEHEPGRHLRNEGHEGLALRRRPHLGHHRARALVRTHGGGGVEGSFVREIFFRTHVGGDFFSGRNVKKRNSDYSKKKAGARETTDNPPTRFFVPPERDGGVAWL